jgi:hypothetical protein
MEQFITRKKKKSVTETLGHDSPDLQHQNHPYFFTVLMFKKPVN